MPEHICGLEPARPACDRGAQIAATREEAYDAACDRYDADRQIRGQICAAARYLREGRWFILQQTPWGTGMVALCREDVLELIETGVA
jgi:hypothetical protein